nr:MAG TPA: hypothetical protein [Caudoviricetes sp.]
MCLLQLLFLPFVIIIEIMLNIIVFAFRVIGWCINAIFTGCVFLVMLILGLIGALFV